MGRAGRASLVATLVCVAAGFRTQGHRVRPSRMSAVASKGLEDLTAPPAKETLRNTYWCIRHGQSTANVANVISSDPVLGSLKSEGYSRTALGIASQLAAPSVTAAVSQLPVAQQRAPAIPPVRRTRSTGGGLKDLLKQTHAAESFHGADGVPPGPTTAKPHPLPIIKKEKYTGLRGAFIRKTLPEAQRTQGIESITQIIPTAKAC